MGLDSLGRPSGEAWLTFVTPEEALRAVRDLNRKVFLPTNMCHKLLFKIKLLRYTEYKKKHRHKQASADIIDISCNDNASSLNFSLSVLDKLQFLGNRYLELCMC